MPGTGLPTTEAVASALGAADFPADKDELLRQASACGAGDDVLAALRSLPVETYNSRDEVLRSVETLDATGVTPSEQAARARIDTAPGVAQHQRTGR